MTMPSHSRLRSFLELAASVRLGVVLLVILSAASVLGTVILQSPLPGGAPEEIVRHYGSTFSRVIEVLRLTDVFHALWYQALLGLVGLNVLCATISRFSLRPGKLGFVLAHVGVLLVLLGGLLYSVRGEKGVITLREKQSSGKFLSRRGRGERPLPFTVTLDRFAVEYYPAEMVFVGPKREALSVKPQAGREVTLAWDGTRVRFEQVVENARRVVEVLPGSSGPPHPAAHLRIETEEKQIDFWRFARRTGAPDALLKMDGRIAVAFDPEEVARTNPLATQATLYVINRSTAVLAELPATVGRTFQLPDVTPPATGEILEVLDDADNTTLGPGLRIQIHSGESFAWRHVFAGLPDFVPDAFTGPPLRFPEIRFIYYRPRQILYVMQKAGPAYELRSWEKGTWREQPIVPNQPVQVGPVKLTLLEVLPAAHVETRYDPAEEPTGIEAVLLDVSTPHEEPRRFWMSAVGDDRTMKFGERLTLGYLVSPDVKEYRSELTVDDHTGRPESCMLRVNHPLRHRGWEIFQEGYWPEGTRTVSRLVVSRDPGLTLAEVGFVMLAAGVFFACFIKPVIVRKGVGQ